jgi:hypothetical protein
MSITCSECVSVVLVIQHAQRMRRVISPCVTSLALLNFSTLSHYSTIFGKNVIEHKMCFLIFSTTFVGKISHSKKNSLKYYHRCP